MSKFLQLLMLIAAAVPFLYAAPGAYQHATIVAVERRTPARTYFRDNPSDAPLSAHRVSYDISVRMQCTVYVGRYRSDMDFLPAEFVANHAVDVRLAKNVMFVSVPGSSEVKMGVVRRHRITDSGCSGH